MAGVLKIELPRPRSLKDYAAWNRNNSGTEPELIRGRSPNWYGAGEMTCRGVTRCEFAERRLDVPADRKLRPRAARMEFAAGGRRERRRYLTEQWNGGALPLGCGIGQRY